MGGRLRALREDRGLTLRYVSKYLGGDYNHVREVEHGLRRSHQGEVVELLDLYGVYEQGEREFLVGLARDAFRLPLWEGDFDAPALEVSLLDSLWLESVAERIRCYSAVIVPDLLQTSGYAEAVVQREYGSQVSEQELAWRARAYSRRQREVFDRRPPVGVQAVVAEAALHRPVGAAEEARRAQLDRLATGREGGAVQVRVLPTAASYAPGMDGSFTVFDLPRADVPTVACSPHAGGVAIHDGVAGRWYADAFDRLWEAALSAADSTRLIMDLMQELSTHSMR
ncbi:helix-turn-helix domain-containing protein [Phytohabitans kaempferiae]|uniref:Helix-turn-helix transcriptional regulator n=1 Tax=Phytohabitans kaempferiae TaxID=1620943 RepID=A0ABV6M396_9ACTN